MLSVLRWFVGCWHEWSRWEDADDDGQERRCSKCGKRVWRCTY